MANLNYESILVDNNDNFIEPDDYNLICSECGAIIECECKDQAEFIMKNINYCYNCGIKFDKYL